MKKVLNILLVLIVCLSFTACKSNFVEYDLAKISIQIEETGEELIGSDGEVTGSLKVDFDKLKLEYNPGSKTYRANIKASNNNYSDQVIYAIEWETHPVIIEDWDVYSSFLSVFTDGNGYVSMGNYLERSGYKDLLVITLWSEK